MLKIKKQGLYCKRHWYKNKNEFSFFPYNEIEEIYFLAGLNKYKDEIDDKWYC